MEISKKKRVNTQKFYEKEIGQNDRSTALGNRIDRRRNDE